MFASEKFLKRWARVARALNRPKPAKLRPEAGVRGLVEAAGLFDRDYYLGAYREELGGYSDPLDHFIAVGQYRGYKPNATFDPLVYLLHHPEAKANGPLQHYLEHPRDSQLMPIDLSARSTFPDIAYPIWSVLLGPEELHARDLRDNLAASQNFGQAHTIEFTVDDQTYRLLTPSADEFFDRLRTDRPCAFPRLPHGFWDCLLELENARAEIARTVPDGLFSDEQLDQLARRVFDEMMPALGLYCENFLPELVGGLRGESTSATYLRSVSFKWQPTADNRLFGRTAVLGPMEIRQMTMFADYFKPDVVAYESMAWKRWVYSGDLKQMPALARERPVVLVGAGRVQDLGERWQLPWFIHVEISLNSYTERYVILDRCKAAVIQAKLVAAANKTKRPLVVLQGGSFAYWLIARLYQWDPGVFYLDFGQALHIWFIDDESVWMPWLLFHPRLIMENCELDRFYRDLGIVLPPPFADPAL